MAEHKVASPVTTSVSLVGTDVTLTDETGVSLARCFASGVQPGTTTRRGTILEWSVSPGESTVTRHSEAPSEVDLTHVRAVFRLSGRNARIVLSRICALDLDDDMFPSSAAARTPIAGVATELVRDDIDGLPSYMLLPSRSFGNYLWEVLVDAGEGVENDNR
jgi:sarcosine oxidase gamma subunit